MVTALDIQIAVTSLFHHSIQLALFDVVSVDGLPTSTSLYQLLYIACILCRDFGIEHLIGDNYLK
jgi:hypothetical protein